VTPNPAPDDWPDGVKPLDTLGQLMQLGIDRDNRLYWNGRPVEVRRTLDLSPAQKLGAIIVALGAVLGGLGGCVTGLKDGAEFLCARNVHWLACPSPSAAPTDPAQ
jgi:hypothetical protein